MSALNNSLLLGQEGGGGYAISRSLRFNSSDSAYLSRTPASAGNRKTWTWAGWVKRSGLGSSQTIFAAVQDFYNGTVLNFTSADQIQLFNYVGGAYAGRRITTAVYRDPSAWYHILFVWDSANGTTANRIRLYVNGAEVTVFGTAGDPSSSDSIVNSTNAHYIGADVGFNNQYSNQYLADIHFIDGQALTPSSFGEFSATTGVWMPKRYTGTYGTNGFKLDFSDNSAATATTLGKDSSGNGNNFTPNNLSVTAGAGNDSLVDVPTNGSEVDTGLGGQVRGNYCTLNPLWTNSAFTLSNGNLDATTSSVSDRVCASTFGLSSGKWYWEITVNGGAGLGIGVCTSAVNLSSYLGGTSASRSYDWNANKYPGGASYGATYTTGDVIGVAVDVDAGTLVYYKNGASQGTAFSDLAGSTWFPAIGDNSSSGNVNVSANFGQRPFAYTAPSGFKALCTANLPAPLVTKANQFFDVALYTGNGGTQAITLPGGMSPDLVWIKSRSIGYWHRINDSVRGAQKFLYSNDTSAEGTSTANDRFTSFDATGFTLGIGGDPSADGLNQNTLPYAAWAWDAGNTTVTNTQGSITSSVRANPSAGFSIVTWTQASAGANTIGHGLGVSPSLVIVKSRSFGSEWAVYHAGLGATKFLKLNTTEAAGTVSAYWNNTAPTSSVFSVGSWSNLAGDNLAYCFAPVAGYSSFGSYVGGSNPFVYLGFRPKFILFKSTSAGNWDIYDSSRTPYNEANLTLAPNLSGAEYNAGSYGIDLLSNGFKLDDGQNVSATYIYAAFAESPFQYARAR